MRRDHQEFPELEDEARDRASEDAGSARHSDAPYRDRRDALVERRRALARDHADAERAAERRDKLVRHLDVIDAELREATAPMLEALDVARSCGSRWEDMAGDDATRRCARCTREVHDLARMTREEVHALFSRAERTPGMRLRRRADGRVITGDCPAQPAGTAVRAMRVVAAGVLFGVSAAAGASIAMAPVFSGGHVLTRSARASAPPIEEEIGEALPAPRVIAPRNRAVVPRVVPPVHVVALAGQHADPGRSLQSRARVPRSAPITTADVDAHVRWIAPQAWEIDRELVERALHAPTLPGTARLIPHQRGRGPGALRVYGVRSGSALARLGIENGDTLLDVNGYPLGEPDRVLEAYTRLRDSDSFFVRLERHGEERVHVYRIVE